MKKQLIAVFASVTVSGCALFDANHDFTRAQSESNPAGVKGLLRGNELRFLSTADLVQSFVPGGARGAAPAQPVAAASKPTKADHDAAQAAEQRATDQAIAEFYQYYLTGSPGQRPAPVTGALLRNEIQDRILAAANQRCHLWKNYYSTASSTVGFVSGVTAATTGAAAVAFSPESTKDALTALSSTATAVGTNYDKSYLFGLTLGVIYQGVDSRRANILKSILGKRVSGSEVAPLGNYTLSAAIEDALEYHGACSVASGAQEAAERIADARNAKPEETSKPEEKPKDGKAGAVDGGKGAPAKDGGAKGGDKTRPEPAKKDGEAGGPTAMTSETPETARTASPASVAPPAVNATVPQAETDIRTKSAAPSP